jgi:hypothetical protein
MPPLVVRQRDLAPQALEAADGVEAGEFGEQPASASLTPEDIQPRLGLRDQGVFLERFGAALESYVRDLEPIAAPFRPARSAILICKCHRTPLN